MKFGLADVLRAIGLRQEEAVEHGGRLEEIRIYLETDRGRVYVGRLRRDGEGYFFAYTPEFIERADLPPIPDLPDKRRTYRSSSLWPFFLARLPPTDRPDVQQQLTDAGIEPADTLEVLAKLGRRAISSPYDLEPVAH